MKKPRKWLLTQNSELRKTGVYAWTLPAHWVELSNSESFNTCPNAGICAAFCYAKAGRWRFKTVLQAHRQKLEMLLNDLEGWQAAMLAELQHKRYSGKFIRIHDGGDFFSKEYAVAWLQIATVNPDKTFYTYTKEVQLFKMDLRGRVPKNFIVVFSYGGKQDNLIDPGTDRHADVFPDLESLRAAGYEDNAADDRIACMSMNHKIGIVANNIPHLRRKQ